MVVVVTVLILWETRTHEQVCRLDTASVFHRIYTGLGRWSHNDLIVIRHVVFKKISREEAQVSTRSDRHVGKGCVGRIIRFVKRVVLQWRNDVWLDCLGPPPSAL